MGHGERVGSDASEIRGPAVVLVSAGTLTGAGHTLGSGDCLAVPEGSTVAIELSPRTELVTVPFDAVAARDTLELNHLALALDAPRMLPAGTAMAEFVARHDVRSADDAARADLVVLLALELGRSDEELARCPGRSDDGRRKLYDRLIASKLLVHTSHGNVSVSSLAAAAGLSPWYYVRTFHAVFGVTPYQYALDRRMAYARHLLVETEASVRQIALTVGFGNSSAFVRAFGQRFGVAPTRVRRDRRNEISEKSPAHRGLREGAEAKAGAPVGRIDGPTTRTYTMKTHKLAGEAQ